MVRLLCAIVVAESCLMSSDKKERNTAQNVRNCGVVSIYVYIGALKLPNTMPSIDTYKFPPWYSDYIWYTKLATTISV